jgi:hypothetical protein
MIAAVLAAATPETIQRVDSPDGSQRAEVTVYPCVDIGEQEGSYERLNLIDNSTGEVSLLAEQVIYCGGLGGFGLWVQRWSGDGAYLYYTDAREGVPDGQATAWVSPLWRVQLADLAVESLGQAQFSPDGAWLALWDQTQVRIIPSAGDGTTATAFDRMPAGLQMFQATWLPDSSGLLYIQADTLYGPVSRSAVTHVDLAASAQTVLLDSSK